MTVLSSLRFTQGLNTDIAGRAVKGTLSDGACVVSNGSNTGVTSWKYELLYSPPGSAVTPVTQGPGVTATFTFTPDVAGTYRFRLTVVGATALDTDVDIRCFCVSFPNGIIAPPYQRNPAQLPLTGVGAKADEMNLGGQPFGWDGDADTNRKLLYQALKQLDESASGDGPYLPLDGHLAMTGDLNMGLHGVHRADHVWIGPTVETTGGALYVNDGVSSLNRVAVGVVEDALQVYMRSTFVGGSAGDFTLQQTYGGANSSSGSLVAGHAEATWATATTTAFDVSRGDLGRVIGLSVDDGIEPLRQWIGSEFNVTSILTVPALTDVTAALANGGAGLVDAFGAVGSGIQVGDSSVFNQIALYLDRGATDGGVDLTLEYSTGVGTWAPFTAEERSAGLSFDGSIRFNALDFPGWLPGLSGNYWVRLKRTAVTVATTPLLRKVQLVAGFVAGWNEFAQIVARSVRFEPYSTAPGPGVETALWFDGFASRLRLHTNTIAYTTDIPTPVTTNELQSTGVLTGGVVTVNANPARFDVTSGTGQFIDNTTFPPTRTNGSWTAFTAVVVTGLATQQTTYLGMSNTGNLVQQNTPFTLLQQRSTIALARLVHNDLANIDNVISDYQTAYGLGMDLQGFFDIFGSVNLSGNQWTANGANLQLNKSAGTSWRRGAAYPSSRVLPVVTTDASATAASWRYAHRNPAATSGFTVLTAGTAVTPDVWDNGSGTLQTVPNGNWTVQWIYVVSGGTSATYRIQPGQTLYASSAAAIAGISVDAFVVSPALLHDGVLCTRLVVKKGTTALNSTGAIFLSAGKFGAQVPVGGSGIGTITGSSGTTDRRLVLNSGTLGTVIQSATTASVTATDVLEGVVGIGFTAIATNPGTVAAGTLWWTWFDGRLRLGANTLAYLSEAGGNLILSPALVSTQQDNYNPTNWITADVVRAGTTGSDVLFTGFVLAGVTTPRKYIFNVGATGNILIANESVFSTNVNRVRTPGGRTVAIPPGGGGLLMYDSVTGRWRFTLCTNRFQELSDTPASWTGAGGQVATVNAGETALAFAGIPSSFVTSVPLNAYAAPIAPGQTITAARWTPTTCRLRALVAPTVSTLTVTVKVNGTSIGVFTLAAAATTSSAAFSTLTTRVAGDVITVELTGTDTGWSGLIIEANGTVLLA